MYVQDENILIFSNLNYQLIEPYQLDFINGYERAPSGSGLQIHNRISKHTHTSAITGNRFLATDDEGDNLRQWQLKIGFEKSQIYDFSNSAAGTPKRIPKDESRQR